MPSRNAVKVATWRIPFLKSTCMYMYGTYQNLITTRVAKKKKNLITTLFEGVCMYGRPR
jgi:hypothetical protein